jgi:hypothetical protein
VVRNGGQQQQKKKNGQWTAKSDKTVSKIGGTGKVLLSESGGQGNAIQDKANMAKNPRPFKRLYKAHRGSLGGE